MMKGEPFIPWYHGMKAFPPRVICSTPVGRAAPRPA